MYQQIRPWGTTTRELMAMAQWLQTEGVTQVAMESTGVYWKPMKQLQQLGVTLTITPATA